MEPFYIIFTIIFCGTLFLLTMFKCIRKRKLLKLLAEVGDDEFVEEFLKIFYAPKEYVIAQRHKLARQLWVSFKILAPDFKFGVLEDCRILVPDGDKSALLIELLSDHLSKYIESPLYGEELNIETVSEYIYYSAIRDGVLLVFK